MKEYITGRQANVKSVPIMMMETACCAVGERNSGAGVVSLSTETFSLRQPSDEESVGIIFHAGGCTTPAA
jgi:hypothetical protein